MDQDSTKDGAGGSDRRNWRERLGVGQDLPKISDEFKSEQKDPQPAGGDAQTDAPSGAQSDVPSGPRPGTPVARPAPMAPRFARSTAPRPGNGNASSTETLPPKPAEAARSSAGSGGLKPWATSIRPAHKPAEPLRHQRPMGEAGRPGAGQPPSSLPSSAPSSLSVTPRPGYAPRTGPLPGAQRPAPSRGPAAYPQAAQRPGTVPSAAGNDSFGERLRAQREAAERLAQQRLAAARNRSGHASAEAPTILTPRKAEATPQGQAVPRHAPSTHPKPAGGEQPRFTFAQEEIVAAQQETAFSPDAPAAGGHQHHAPAPPPHAYVTGQQAAAGGPALQTSPEGFVAGAPEYRPEYRHEDDGMFEDEQPGLHTVPPRASAADYSAAYREFEDEFEDEPRRGRGPLLLLLSLAAVAVFAGGLVYWYQQLQGSPAPEASDLPVISAPEEPAKADPLPQQQPQQAAQPTTRKQIYDRIIGEETLEPERIVPTEEAPQLRQIQQPDRQQPRASGAGESENPGAARQNQSTEPLPLPLPPPPGTGEQGDLLVPGMADTQTALAPPAPAQLSLPEPGATSTTASTPMDARGSREATVEPAFGNSAPPPLDADATAELRDTTAAPETAQEADASVRSSIYPEPVEPLAYPNIRVESPPPHDQTESDEGRIAALPEREVEMEAEPATEPEVEAEPEVEQALNVPLPKTKPEPPVRTAARQAPQPQRQAAPQPSGSGPVQILPTDLSSGQPATQSWAVQQPPAQSAPPRRTVGREFDPLEGQRTTFSGASSVQSQATVQQPTQPQQMASIAPDTARSQTQSAGGYVVQLASFRSESEARAEFQRLVLRHPQLVSGLNSRIQEASLGQSGSFYRLGVGPLADRNAATKLCNDLIAAGEKDCLVRRQ